MEILKIYTKKIYDKIIIYFQVLAKIYMTCS